MDTIYRRLSPAILISILGLCLGACARDSRTATAPTPPSARDIPAPEPMAPGLAGAPCPGIARYLAVRQAIESQLSPDGRRLIFLTTITGLPQLWRVTVPDELSDDPRDDPRDDPDAGADTAWPEQLTFGDRVQLAAWSPTGAWIAYGTDRGGNERTQLRLLAPDGTREHILTPADEHFRNFGGWSPSGDRIAYSSTQRNGQDFGIYLLDIAPDGTPGREPRMVLEGTGNTNVASWRPDGEALVITRGRGELDNDLFLLDLRSGALETLFQPARMSRYTGIEWLPDGAGFFLATNHEREFAGLARYHLATRTLHWIHTPDHDVESVALSADGRMLAWTVNHSGFSRLHLLDRDSDRRVPLPPIPAGVISSLDWAEDAPRLTIAVSGPDLPGDTWVYDASTGALARITHSSLAGLDPRRFVVPEPVSFPSFDRELLHALLYMPGTTGTPRPPVILKLHGGPTSQARPGFDAVIQYLLGRGYAVLDLDYRGSTGHGQRFTQLDDKRRRLDAVRDMKAAVQWLRARADLDGERVAAMGRSYGGFMVLAALCFPDEGHELARLHNRITAYQRIARFLGRAIGGPGLPCAGK